MSQKRSTMQEKVAVVGGGAMGTVFGSALAEAGYETTVVDVQPDLVAAIRESGLTVHREGSSRRIPVAATTDAGEVGVVDLVLFLVKSYHTGEAARTAAVLADSDTVVATLQNGLGHGDALAEVFDRSRIVLGVTAESGTTVGPGAVEHPGRAVTFVGPYDGDRLDAAEQFAAMLTHAGFDARPTAAIATEIWKKLVLGTSTLAAPALLGMTCGQILAHAEMSALMDATIVETVAVARALGYDVDARERLDYTHALLAEVEDAKGSMVQDIAAGRTTEIDAINGAVVAAAASIGVGAPINQTLLGLVKGWEAMRSPSSVETRGHVT
jgi:2-dehydropantoate 2-reductase